MSEKNKHDIVHVVGVGLMERWQAEEELERGYCVMRCATPECKDALRSAVDGPAWSCDHPMDSMMPRPKKDEALHD